MQFIYTMKGHRQAVGVSDAGKLVVQNLANPAWVFRLLSTWPTGAGTAQYSR